jgi:inosine/xanthosine triphosphate pyrophosphatase family protein
MTRRKLNTSNQHKFEEFKHLFGIYGDELDATHIDLKEIVADPITVVVHKASQLEEDVLVEDTSLEIEGVGSGVEIRWFLDHLPHYVGKKAVWTVLLAYHKASTVFVYQGITKGRIVAPTGSTGFGFDPFFLPEGAQETLAESKLNQYSARAKAVQALVKNNRFARRPLIKNWMGSWQTDRST